MNVAMNPDFVSRAEEIWGRMPEGLTLSQFVEMDRHEGNATGMSTISISIPDSLRQRAETLAREDGLPLDAFVANVLSQRVAVAEVDSCIRHRARKGSAETMLDILDQAPPIEPEEQDRIK